MFVFFLFYRNKIWVLTITIIESWKYDTICISVNLLTTLIKSNNLIKISILVKDLDSELIAKTKYCNLIFII